jgi:hypothetical protein
MAMISQTMYPLLRCTEVPPFEALGDYSTGKWQRQACLQHNTSIAFGLTALDEAALVLEGAAPGEDRHTAMACTKRCPQDETGECFYQWQIQELHANAKPRCF